MIGSDFYLLSLSWMPGAESLQLTPPLLTITVIPPLTMYKSNRTFRN